MGFLETGVPLKRTAPLLHSSSAAGRRPRLRSRVPRFLIKVHYLHWALAVAVFFLVVVLFQAFLPGSAVEGPPQQWGSVLEGVGDLDYGDGIKFVPTELVQRLDRENQEANASAMAFGEPLKRFPLRNPQLAVVVPDLYPDAMQLKMVSIAAALKESGFDIQVFSFHDGPARIVWRSMGIFVKVLPIVTNPETTVDWLDYNGILVNSIQARPVFSCLLQEPFRSVPVIWTIHESSPALRLVEYSKNGQFQLVNEWKQVFSRATVIVFPTHSMPMMYSTFDTGNFMVIPGSPAEAWEADNFVAMQKDHILRESMSSTSDNFLIVVVGSQFSYSGMLLEHALVLEALRPLLQKFPSSNSFYSLLKVHILGWNFTSAYKKALEVIAEKVGYPGSIVEHIVINGDTNRYLGVADLVIYGSFLEEQSFPNILKQSMSLGKLIIAPDLNMIRKYVDNKVNGYLFPKENISMLTQILLQATSNGKLSLLAQRVASVAKGYARNLMASEAIQGHVSLLEKVLRFPSEIMPPKAVEQIPPEFKMQWQWELFANVRGEDHLNSSFRSHKYLDTLEEQWNHSQMQSSANTKSKVDEALISIEWEEEKKIEMMGAGKITEEELDRSDQPHGLWEEVYKNVKRAERASNELHERDERELERTGQPLCIYEPYFGEGTWPFLHQTSLYRGISLSSVGRRPEADDIDASSHLPILRDGYYRDVLGEYGAFFTLAYQIDSIHKNAWIAFQSWRASARKVSLSRKAETQLLEAIEHQTHGDALYFWVRMDKDPRNPQNLNFWRFCDTINAGNCRTAVSEAFRRMYGVGDDWSSLPQMPDDGDSWSVMHSWALPTRSFLEFVMFSRMFIDAMDTKMYDEHHQSASCYLSTSKDRHCYARVLELLVNVWAYHSARHMVYVDPESGSMEEYHRPKSRRGKMWIQWFSYSTLKSMDEDLAEEADADHPDRRWLWPSTGDVFWQGTYEREMNKQQRQKERKKQETKDRIQRIKKRARQKTLGRYVKPPPERSGYRNTSGTI
ncbi:uncharacterized protein LOC103997010 [Musa acuminata AAA Group]|uniref:uncharacterized protein LOC103997010 n=1 Tax=Musa acuminata AAA Group TaxID=214697 RepID=UPI0031E3EB53